MLYEALRATATIALRWYYGDVVVQGRERVPGEGPLVLIANHPNALIDPLLVGTALRRRILLTAKATLFESPALAALLKSVGVVPLRRAKDESPTSQTLPSTRERNADAFGLVTRALLDQEAVLVFPEGISHDQSSLAPLKSGAARMALQARSEGAIGLRIVPIGLIFEEKERPGSRVLVRVGEPLLLDEWVPSGDVGDATELTMELDARLRSVTLNFATAAQASRAVNLARSLAAIASAPASLSSLQPLDTETDIALRVDAATTALASASPAVIAATDALTTRLGTIEDTLARRGVTLSDVRISSRLRPGLRFIIREGLWAALASIVTVLGGWTHWIPLTLARRSAIASLRGDSSRDQPAMRTILFGIAFVVMWYVALGALLAVWLGWQWSVAALVLLFASAHAHRLLRHRPRRAARRARTYLALRTDPDLQRWAIAELDSLIADALALELALSGAVRPLAV